MLSGSPLTARHLADSETAVAELNAPNNLHSHQLDIRMLAVTASWSIAKVVMNNTDPAEFIVFSDHFLREEVHHRHCPHGDGSQSGGALREQV